MTSFDSDSILAGDSSSLPSFDEPWQARAFAIAVAITNREDTGSFEWDEFNAAFVSELDGTAPLNDDIENRYYDEWVDAIETLLLDAGVISPGEYEERTREFKSGNRDASEFVEGDPHTHVSGHDHADGS